MKGLLKLTLHFYILVQTQCLIQNSIQIGFKITMNTNLNMSKNLFSFSSETKTHHNFSNFITGSLRNYMIQTRYNSLSNEKGHNSSLKVFSVKNFTNPKYKEFIEDFLNLQFTQETQMVDTNCEYYFQDACENYHDTEFVQNQVMQEDELRSENFLYIFDFNEKSQPSEDQTLYLRTEVTGIIDIIFFELSDQLYNSIIMVLGVWITVLVYDYFSLYKKKKNILNQINSLKNKEE